jgi:hypothetical protein
MARTLAVLAACLALSLPGCGKSTPPGMTGSGGFKVKDPVWVTYGWSKGRMIYVIFFVPNATSSFNPEGVAATVALGKDREGDSFDGALDGYQEKSKVPFKATSKTYEVSFEGKTLRTANGPVFLIKVGPPSKIEQIQAQISGPPKDEPDIPQFMENQVRKLLKEHPKIAEFPKEPAPDPKTKKK